MPTRRFDNLDPERRSLLLDSAAEEFSRHGYKGAAIARILDRSGFSKGSLYYYFEDKPDLYATVVMERVARWMSRIEPPEAVVDAAAYWAEMERLMRASLQAYSDDPWLPGLVRSLDSDGGAVANLAPTRELMLTFNRGLAELGQLVGAVRTDLPLSLIVSLSTAVSQGFDLWVAEHWEGMDEHEREAFVLTSVSLYKRLADPP